MPVQVYEFPAVYCSVTCAKQVVLLVVMIDELPNLDHRQDRFCSLQIAMTENWVVNETLRK
jgi:hypothetical protein